MDDKPQGSAAEIKCLQYAIDILQRRVYELVDRLQVSSDDETTMKMQLLQKRKTMSEAGRAAVSAAQKARWAKVRKDKANHNNDKTKGKGA